MASAPTVIDLERKPSLLQRLFPSCANFSSARRHWSHWRAKGRCVDEPWPASVIRIKSTHPAVSQFRQTAQLGCLSSRNAGDNGKVTIEALPITVTSISIQTVGVPHAQADNKAVDQATSSCPTATNTVKVPRNEAARSRDVGGHGASYLQEHVAPHRSSLGCKQLQSSPVAANKRASRPSSAPSGLNRSERERNANSCFFICKPAVCHPRPPSKQISVECTDDSFPYPSPLPLPPSQLDIAEQFEERMSELARLQRETVLYEKHQRHTRQLHRSVSKQSLTKASSYQTGNATQSRGKRSEKRGSCTSLDAFSNAALAQQRQLASVSSPHIGSQSRRHSVSSRPSQTGSRSKSKRHKRSLRRHSVAP